MFVTVLAWQKVRECEQAIQSIVDAAEKARCTHVRDFWITLANESQIIDPTEMLAEYAALLSVHRSIVTGPHHLLH